MLSSAVKIAALGGAAWLLRRGIRRRTATDLDGQVVLITGGSRGLGLAMAREFAREGCRLVLTARNAEQLERARKDVHGITDVLAIPCDVSKREQVDNLVAQARERFGPIDILVNNAGTITMGPVDTQTEEDFHEALGIMFWGAYYPTMAVLPEMVRRHEGRIINITSIGGVIGTPHLLPYSAAKSAAIGFSQGLHGELRSRGVRVTTVIPGFMRTGSYRNAIFKGRHREEYRWFSLGAAVPVTSTTAPRAARKIVDAAKHGDATLLITPYVKLVMLANAISPGLVSFAIGAVGRFLPKPGGIGAEGRPGYDSETGLTDSFVTVLGRRAARNYQHQ